MAAEKGKVDVVRLLIEAGAQLNIQTKVNVHIMDVFFTYLYMYVVDRCFSWGSRHCVHACVRTYM